MSNNIEQNVYTLNKGIPVSIYEVREQIGFAASLDHRVDRYFLNDIPVLACLEVGRWLPLFGARLAFPMNDLLQFFADYI